MSRISNLRRGEILEILALAEIYGQRGNASLMTSTPSVHENEQQDLICVVRKKIEIKIHRNRNGNKNAFFKITYKKICFFFSKYI